MSDELLLQVVKDMAKELAEIRRLLADMTGKQAVQVTDDQALAETHAEFEMIDAQGLDPLEYLRNKCRNNRKKKGSHAKQTH